MGTDKVTSREATIHNLLPAECHTFEGLANIWKGVLPKPPPWPLPRIVPSPLTNRLTTRHDSWCHWRQWHTYSWKRKVIFFIVVKHWQKYSATRHSSGALWDRSLVSIHTNIRTESEKFICARLTTTNRRTDGRPAADHSKSAGQHRALVQVTRRSTDRPVPRRRPPAMQCSAHPCPAARPNERPTTTTQCAAQSIDAAATGRADSSTDFRCSI